MQPLRIETADGRDFFEVQRVGTLPTDLIPRSININTGSDDGSGGGVSDQALQQEVANREAGDYVLRQALTAETQQRGTDVQAVADRVQQNEGDIDTLQNRLTNEARTREQDDTALGDRIQALEDTETVTPTTLAQETQARTQADTVLQNNINAERDARSSAVNGLNGRLETLEEADNASSEDLAAEAQTRANADTAETNARNTAVTTINQRIDGVETASNNADTALSNRINTLENAPTPEGGITEAQLNAVATASTDRDTALSNRIDTVEAIPTVNVTGGDGIRVDPTLSGNVRTFNVVNTREAGSGGTTLADSGLNEVGRADSLNLGFAGGGVNLLARVRTGITGIEAGKIYLLWALTDNLYNKSITFRGDDFLGLTAIANAFANSTDRYLATGPDDPRVSQRTTFIAGTELIGQSPIPEIPGFRLFRLASNELVIASLANDNNNDPMPLVLYEYVGAQGEVTTQQIVDAINGLPEANPYSYNLKFTQATSQSVLDNRQTAVAMNSVINNSVNVRTATGNIFSVLITPGTNGVYNAPAALLPDIPFITSWEGTTNLRAQAAGSDSTDSFMVVKMRMTHFAGGGQEFTNERQIEERLFRNADFGIALSSFNSNVTLPQSIIDRFPVSSSTLPIKVELIFELYSDAAHNNPKNWSILQTAELDFSAAGLSFTQLRPIVGPEGPEGMGGGQTQEQVAEQVRSSLFDNRYANTQQHNARFNVQRPNFDLTGRVAFDFIIATLNATTGNLPTQAIGTADFVDLAITFNITTLGSVALPAPYATGLTFTLTLNDGTTVTVPTFNFNPYYSVGNAAVTAAISGFQLPRAAAITAVQATLHMVNRGDSAPTIDATVNVDGFRIEERGALYIDARDLVNRLIRQVYTEDNQTTLNNLSTDAINSIVNRLIALEQFNNHFTVVDRQEEEAVPIIQSNGMTADSLIVPAGGQVVGLMTRPGIHNLNVYSNGTLVRKLGPNDLIASTETTFTWDTFTATAGNAITLTVPHETQVLRVQADVADIQSVINDLAGLITADLRRIFGLFSVADTTDAVYVASSLASQLSRTLQLRRYVDSNPISRPGSNLSLDNLDYVFDLQGDNSLVRLTSADNDVDDVDLITVESGRLVAKIPAVQGVTRTSRQQVGFPLTLRKLDIAVGEARIALIDQGTPTPSWDGVGSLTINYLVRENGNQVASGQTVLTPSAPEARFSIAIPLDTLNIHMTLNTAGRYVGVEMSRVGGNTLVEEGGDIIFTPYADVTTTTGAVPARTIDIAPASDTVLACEYLFEGQRYVKINNGTVRTFVFADITNGQPVISPPHYVATFNTSQQHIPDSDLIQLYPHREDARLGLLTPQARHHVVATLNSQLAVLDDDGNTFTVERPVTLPGVRVINDPLNTSYKIRNSPTQDADDDFIGRYAWQTGETKITIYLAIENNSLGMGTPITLHRAIIKVGRASVTIGAANLEEAIDNNVDRYFATDTQNFSVLQVNRWVGVEVFTSTTPPDTIFIKALNQDLGIYVRRLVFE